MFDQLDITYNTAESVKPLVVEILTRVRVRIAYPGRWTQTVSARDVLNHPVPFISTQACKWCLLGAVALECRRYDGRINKVMLEKYVIRAVKNCLPDPRGLVANYNDEHTHAEVLKLVDYTIACMAV